MTDRCLKLRFFNVGYGEALLLTAQNAQGGAFTMLIDGGSAEDAEYAGFPQRVRAAEALSELGVTRLDVLLNTHIHEDHTCGLTDIAAQMEIGEYWCCTLPAGNESWPSLPGALADYGCSGKFLRALNAHRALLSALRARGVPVRMLIQDAFAPARTLAPGLAVSVLGPTRAEAADMCALLAALYAEPAPEARAALVKRADKSINNHSVMLMLDYHGTRILLPGDTNRLGYGHLDAEALRADVFKIGHHGQRDGVDEGLAAAVAPRVVVVCASSDRRYNSMHPDALSLLAAVGRAEAPVRFLLSDVPELPPWTDNVPPHRASELTLGMDGDVALLYS